MDFASWRMARDSGDVFPIEPTHEWGEALYPELERFAKDFDHCVKTLPSRRHFRRYLAGQMSSLQRKCVEPIALMTGVAPRTLQEFLALHRWDNEAMMDCLQRRVAQRHEHENAIGLIDETSFAKKGDKSPGVQRQHCGATGKVDNCVVSVHLGYAADDFHAILDSEVFIPEGWLQDEDRCREAGIAPDAPFRTKIQIALDQLARAKGGPACPGLDSQRQSCTFASPHTARGQDPIVANLLATSVVDASLIERTVTHGQRPTADLLRRTCSHTPPGRQCTCRLGSG